MKKITGIKGAILIFFIFTITHILSVFLYIIIKDSFFYNSPDYNDLIYTATSLIILLIFFLLFKKEERTMFIINCDSKWDRYLLIVLLLPFLFRIAADPILRFNEIINPNLLLKEDFINDAKFSYIKAVFVFFKTVIVASIVEEIVFRGYMLKALRNSTIQTQIFLTSLLFTLIHIPDSISSLIFIFIFGLLTAIIAKRFGVLFSIIFHVVHNLIWYITYIYANEYWKIIKFLNFKLSYWGIIFVSIIIFYSLLKKHFNICKK